LEFDIAKYSLSGADLTARIGKNGLREVKERNVAELYNSAI
jgi:hypothetical protein